MCNLEIKIEKISLLHDKSLQWEGDDIDLLFSDLSHKLFPYFKTSLKILTNNSYQDIPLPPDPSLDRFLLRGHQNVATPKLAFKQLMSFGPRYLAALRDNLNSRFDCKTLKLCRKFKLLLDSTLYILTTDRFFK